jgi:hypothetical protein
LPCRVVRIYPVCRRKNNLRIGAFIILTTCRTYFAHKRNKSDRLCRTAICHSCSCLIEITRPRVSSLRPTRRMGVVETKLQRRNICSCEALVAAW